MSISTNNTILQTTNLETTTSLENPSSKVPESTSNKTEKDESVDRSKISELINTTKEEEVSNPPQHSLEHANKTTHELEQLDIITQMSGKKITELKLNGLPPEVTKLLDESEALQSRHENASTIQEKLSLLTDIQTTLESFEEALKNINKDEKSEPLQTDLLVENTLLLDDLDDSLNAVNQLLNEHRLLKETLGQIKSDLADPVAFSEVQESIKQCEELTEKDRTDLLKGLEKALQDKIEADLQTDSTVQEILSKGPHAPNQKEVLAAAAKILARIALANPYLKEKVGFAALFRSFSFSRTENDLPEIKGASDEDRLVTHFAESLCVLAAITDPDIGIDARTFCHVIDRFAGHRLEHFAVMGELLKGALAPTDEIRHIALAQQEFQVSLKTLLSSLTPKDLAKFGSLKSIEALSTQGLLELTRLPKFQNIANHVAALVLMQSELIRQGAINLVQVVKDDPHYAHTNVILGDKKAQQALNNEIAQDLIDKFAKAVDNEDVSNLITACSGERLFKEGSTTEFNPKYQLLINKLTEMREDYLVRSIQGEKQEKDLTGTLKKISNKLTGTTFSDNYLEKLYDLNINTKAARVFDGLMLELTGILDPKERNLLKPEDRDIVSAIGKESTNTLIGALADDSSKLLKNTGNTKLGANTLQDLLFDREAAKQNGFNFENLDKKVNEVLKEQSDAYMAIKGTRRRVITSLQHETDFAIQNDEAVKLHLEKKALNANVKTHKANASKVFTCFWHWKDREANVKKILDLGMLKDNLDILLAMDPAKLEPADEERKETLQKQIETAFGELKDLNLSNLAKHNSKEELSLEDFLKQALPLAKAIDYMRISKQVKTDTAKIKELKKQRKAAREKVDDYLKEAKKAYGNEVVLQIQRAVIMATYFVGKDTDSQPMSFQERENATVDFLKKNTSIMKDCDKGVLGLIVKDALRRYTPPVGPMSHKYLDRIHNDLGTGKSRGTSLRLKTAEKTLPKDILKQYKTSATRMYQDRGAEGLMTMIDKPGSSFMYSKKTSFTLSTMPALMQASLSYMPSESFCVTNTGSGFRVLVKSDHAVKIAASAGFRFPHSGQLNNLAAINVGVNAQLAGKKGHGLELKFKNEAETIAFVKDFMNPDSPMHLGQKYNSSWHTSEDIRLLSNFELSGGIDASAKAAIRVFVGKNPEGKDVYSNQLHFGGNQDFTKVKNLQDYFATLDPTQSGNPVSKISVKLPSVKLEVGLSGGTKHSESINRNTISKRASRQMQIKANLDVTQFQLQHTFKPLYKEIWGNLGKLVDPKSELVTMLTTAFEQADPKGDKATLVADYYKKALQAAQRGEIDEANTQLKNAMEYLTGPALDKFTDLPTKNKQLHNLQNLMKIAAFESNANHLGILKAGTQTTGLTTNDGKITAGINANIGPIGTTVQGVGNVISNLSTDAELTSHSNAQGKVVTEENSKDKNLLESAAPYVTKAGQYTSTIYNLLMGDPMLAAANIIGLSIGEHTLTDVKKQHTTTSASLNDKDILGGSIDYRNKHLEFHGKASLKEGVSLGISGNIFGTCDTETVNVYDFEKHQYLSETGIDYKITKSKFSLENLLEMLHLPAKLADELQANTSLMKAILQAYVYSGPNDVFTLKTQIKPAVLKEMNRLELQMSLEPDKAKTYQKEIDKLLEDPDNYTPVAITVSHNDVRELRLALEMSEMNFGFFSFSHHRELTNMKTSTISLRSLESVQEALGEARKDSEPTIVMKEDPEDEIEISESDTSSENDEGVPTIKIKEESDIENETSKLDESISLQSHKNNKMEETFIDTSKEAFERENAQTRGTTSNETKPLEKNIQTNSERTLESATGLPETSLALHDENVKKHWKEWTEYAQGVRTFILSNSSTYFSGDTEAQKGLLDKMVVLSTGAPDAFLKDLVKLSSKEEVKEKLVEKFKEMHEEYSINRQFETNALKADQLFEKMPTPDALNKAKDSNEINDYKARVHFRLADRNNYNEWTHAEPNAPRTPEAYLKWTSTQMIDKIKLERSISAFIPGSCNPTDKYPTTTSPVTVGQTFSQNTNTCFLMSIANALAATSEGTALLNNWLKTNPKIDDDLKNSEFETFEQQLATLYRDFVNLNGSNVSHWSKLGSMGEADAVGQALGLDTRSTHALTSEPWQQRELWYDVSRALKSKDVITLFTPGHYRAVVGTYGDPRQGDYGFVVRDSNQEGSGKQYPVSINSLAQIENSARVCLQKMPDPKLAQPWKISSNSASN